MAEEKAASATPRRSRMRSCSAASASPLPAAAVPPSKTRDAAPLLSPEISAPEEQPTSLDDLLAALPGRRTQIHELLRLIGPAGSPMLPLLLYGGASTGKTATVTRVLRHLRRPFVYTSLRSCYSSRLVFDSVLNQLVNHRRCAGNGYASAKKCERLSDFIALLREALAARICEGNLIYLVFDGVELLRFREKSSSGLISILFRIHDLLRIPQLGLIYISRASPDAYYSFFGSTEPIDLHFPCYSTDDLYQIFMRSQSNPKIYAAFLSVSLKPLCRITRRVDELSIALEPLFKRYCEPLRDLSVVPDESMKRRLFHHIKPYLAAALDETFEVPSFAPGGGTSLKEISKKSGRKDNLGGELGFHLSVSASYLLISAFLASRNPATLDAALFDSTGGLDNRKRKRKTMKDQDDDLAAEDALMKGPGSFPLERLLAIFQCITSVADVGPEEEELEEEGFPTNGGKMGLMADVLLQLSTLKNANFVIGSGNCLLEGSTRLRSTIETNMALKVARSVNFPLSKYLYRGR